MKLTRSNGALVSLAAASFSLVMAIPQNDLKAADPAPQAPADSLLVFIGTYTGPKSQGIYRFRFSPATGDAGAAELAGKITNPSFLAIHPNRKFVYAVSEVANFEGKDSGSVVACSIDPDRGNLTTLNAQGSGGTGPCHLIVDKSGENLLVANYGSGSVAALPIDATGRLGPVRSKIQHEGKSANPQRQAGPHAHSINLDAANRFAIAADLGLDQLLVYQFDSLLGTLKPNNPPFARLDPGAGPRHFAFHPDGKFGYVINEMHCTVTALRYDAKAGTFEAFQTIPTIPAAPKPSDSTAEIQVHPSGRFVYGSNRGHDSIAVFRVEPATGRLTFVENQSTQGRTPRNFGIEPGGRFLLAANQNSDTVVIFRIDPQTGRLTPTGAKVEVPAPVCVKFLPPPRG